MVSKKNIINSAKEYCRVYNINFSDVLSKYGGEDNFCQKVVELDSTAKRVSNVDSNGRKYVCKPISRIEPNGLMSWGYDEGYASYSSAEILCRGGEILERGV